MELFVTLLTINREQSFVVPAKSGYDDYVVNIMDVYKTG